MAPRLRCENARSRVSRRVAARNQSVAGSRPRSSPIDTERHLGAEDAKVAEACGLRSLQVTTKDPLTEALRAAVTAQMEKGVTTSPEAVLNQEPGEAFRREALAPQSGLAEAPQGSPLDPAARCFRAPRRRNPR